MSDQGVYVAHLEAANRFLRDELAAAATRRAEDAEVIAAQAHALNRQAATITGLRERIATALDAAEDPDRFDCCESCRVEAITAALTGAGT